MTLRILFPTTPVWKGVYWKLLSCLCFAGVNILVRFVSGGSSFDTPKMSIYMIMFYQNIISSLFLLPWLLRAKNIGSFKTHHPYLHFMRITTAVLGVGAWYMSLRYIPVPQAVALSFIGPIITIFGASLFLKEKLTAKKLLAILGSMLGSFLIMRPDQQIPGITIAWALFLPLISATIFAFDKLLTRKLLAVGENPGLVTFYLVFFMAPLAVLPSVYYGFEIIQISQLPWLVMLGIAGALAHFSFSKAYAYSEVTFLMPFGLAKFIFCGFLSFMIFREIPTGIDMWIGIISLLWSTSILSLPESKRHSKQLELEKASA